MESSELPWSPAPGEILTARELLTRVRSLLESSFAWVWLEGEVANFRASSAGHSYFTIGDGSAQIRAVCFRSTLRLLETQPTEGLRVLARGRITLYEARGDIQLVVEDMEPMGTGLLRLELEERKRRLAAEGLFEPGRKRPLPPLPRAVAVVTSPTGAAFRDILKVLERRAPGVSVFLVPARVQGREAPGELRASLLLAGSFGGVDVVILGRGGGSADDLSAFNDEELVRAVAACAVPVISAVGHEIDVTLSDLAADCRAPTPSAAAEMAVREWSHALEQVRRAEGALVSNLLRRIFQFRSRAASLDPLRRSPATRLARLRIRADRALEAMDAVFRRGLERRRTALNSLEGRLARRAPQRRLSAAAERLGRLEERLAAGTRRAIEERRRGLSFVEGRLGALSPLAILSRGYSIARRAGAVVRDAAECGPGDSIDLTLARGGLECLVTLVLPRAEGGN